jgi:hypothetical protein
MKRCTEFISDAASPFFLSAVNQHSHQEATVSVFYQGWKEDSYNYTVKVKGKRKGERRLMSAVQRAFIIRNFSSLRLFFFLRVV